MMKATKASINPRKTCVNTQGENTELKGRLNKMTAQLAPVVTPIISAGIPQRIGGSFDYTVIQASLSYSIICRGGSVVRALVTLIEDLSSILSTHTWQLTTKCNSKSKGDMMPSSDLQRHTHTHKSK